MLMIQEELQLLMLILASEAMDTMCLSVSEAPTRATPSLIIFTLISLEKVFLSSRMTRNSGKVNLFHLNFCKQFNVQGFLLLFSQKIMLPLLGVWMKWLLLLNAVQS